MKLSSEFLFVLCNFYNFILTQYKLCLWLDFCESINMLAVRMLVEGRSRAKNPLMLKNSGFFVHFGVKLTKDIGFSVTNWNISIHTCNCQRGSAVLPQLLLLP